MTYFSGPPKLGSGASLMNERNRVPILTFELLFRRDDPPDSLPLVLDHADFQCAKDLTRKLARKKKRAVIDDDGEDISSEEEDMEDASKYASIDDEFSAAESYNTHVGVLGNVIRMIERRERGLKQALLRQRGVVPEEPGSAVKKRKKRKKRRRGLGDTAVDSDDEDEDELFNDFIDDRDWSALVAIDEEDEDEDADSSEGSPAVAVAGGGRTGRSRPHRRDRDWIDELLGDGDEDPLLGPSGRTYEMGTGRSSAASASASTSTPLPPPPVPLPAPSASVFSQQTPSTTGTPQTPLPLPQNVTSSTPSTPLHLADVPKDQLPPNLRVFSFEIANSLHRISQRLDSLFASGVRRATFDWKSVNHELGQLSRLRLQHYKKGIPGSLVKVLRTFKIFGEYGGGTIKKRMRFLLVLDQVQKLEQEIGEDVNRLRGWIRQTLVDQLKQTIGEESALQMEPAALSATAAAASVTIGPSWPPQWEQLLMKIIDGLSKFVEMCNQNSREKSGELKKKTLEEEKKTCYSRILEVLPQKENLENRVKALLARRSGASDPTPTPAVAKSSNSSVPPPPVPTVPPAATSATTAAPPQDRHVIDLTSPVTTPKRLPPPSRPASSSTPSSAIMSPIPSVPPSPMSVVDEQLRPLSPSRRVDDDEEEFSFGSPTSRGPSTVTSPVRQPTVISQPPVPIPVSVPVPVPASQPLSTPTPPVAVEKNPMMPVVVTGVPPRTSSPKKRSLPSVVTDSLPVTGIPPATSSLVPHPIPLSDLSQPFVDTSAPTVVITDDLVAKTSHTPKKVLSAIPIDLSSQPSDDEEEEEEDVAELGPGLSLPSLFNDPNRPGLMGGSRAEVVSSPPLRRSRRKLVTRRSLRSSVPPPLPPPKVEAPPPVAVVEEEEVPETTSVVAAVPEDEEVEEEETITPRRRKKRKSKSSRRSRKKKHRHRSHKKKHRHRRSRHHDGDEELATDDEQIGEDEEENEDEEEGRHHRHRHRHSEVEEETPSQRHKRRHSKKNRTGKKRKRRHDGDEAEKKRKKKRRRKS